MNEVYTVADVAAMTGLSRSTITRMFESETGVIVLERPEAKHKRRYRTIRIPCHVYERVIRKLTVRGWTQKGSRFSIFIEPRNHLGY